jgi:two-component system, OmpR family, phosphate regulon response regulator PhoB
MAAHATVLGQLGFQPPPAPAYRAPVLRRMKSGPDVRSIPVIILTAKGHEHDVLRGLNAGAVDYIVKPFSLKGLTVRIASALRKQ